MLRLPEIGSHAAFKQLLSQRIHNSRLNEIMRPFLLRGRSSCMAAFLDAAFLLAFHLA